MRKLSLAIPLALLSSAGFIWIEYSKSIPENARIRGSETLASVVAEVGYKHILADILAPTFTGESVRSACKRMSIGNSQPRALATPSKGVR